MAVRRPGQWCVYGRRLSTPAGVPTADARRGGGLSHVRRALKEITGTDLPAEHKGLIFGPVKTAQSERTVALPKFLRELLAEHLAACPPAAPGRTRSCSPGRRAGRCDTSCLPAPLPTRGARRAAGREARAPLPRPPAHLRQSADRRRGAPEGDPVRLGHSDIRITMNRYGHLFPAEDMALADALDATHARHAPAGRRGHGAPAITRGAPAIRPPVEPTPGRRIRASVPNPSGCCQERLRFRVLGRDHRAELAQDRVPSRDPVDVVDIPHPVDVDEHERNRATLALESGSEQAVVPQPGRRVTSAPASTQPPRKHATIISGEWPKRIARKSDPHTGSASAQAAASPRRCGSGEARLRPSAGGEAGLHRGGSGPEEEAELEEIAAADGRTLTWERQDDIGSLAKLEPRVCIICWSRPDKDFAYGGHEHHHICGYCTNWGVCRRGP